MITIDHNALYNKLKEANVGDIIDTASSWYNNFDRTEAKECLKNGASKVSSWAAETIVSLDSKVQEMLGKDHTDNNGDL